MSIQPLPLDGYPPFIWVSENVVGCRRQIQIILFAHRAPINNSYCHSATTCLALPRAHLRRRCNARHWWVISARLQSKIRCISCRHVNPRTSSSRDNGPPGPALVSCFVPVFSLSRSICHHFPSPSFAAGCLNKRLPSAIGIVVRVGCACCVE